MMHIIEMMNRLEAVGDIDVITMKYGYAITINDFGGFDDDWCEIDREFKLPDLLTEFLNRLVNEALMVKGNYYITYYFEDSLIRVGYASYDV